jgi:hypothetical protein
VPEELARPVCVFLIPVVRDSDRKPHPPVLWRLLQDALLNAFGAVTGPETVLYYRNPVAVPGAWSPGAGQEPVEDLSRKYTVAVPEDRLDEIRSLLRRAGNTFDQRVMYLEVAGYAELLQVRPEDGFLDV